MIMCARALFSILPHLRLIIPTTVISSAFSLRYSGIAPVFGRPGVVVGGLVEPGTAVPATTTLHVAVAPPLVTETGNVPFLLKVTLKFAPNAFVIVSPGLDH